MPEGGCFSYSATAMPRLTGALITVAAFMPIGFAQSTMAIRGRHFLDRRHCRAVFMGCVRIITRIAVKMLPRTSARNHGGDPYDTSFIARCAVDRWASNGVGCDGMTVRHSRAWGKPFVPQQLSERARVPSWSSS